MDYTRNVNYDLYAKKVDEYVNICSGSENYKHALRHLLLNTRYGMCADISTQPMSELNSTIRDRIAFRHIPFAGDTIDYDCERRIAPQYVRGLPKFPESWLTKFMTYENTYSDLYRSMSMDLRSMIDTKVSFDNVIHWNCVMTFNTTNLEWWFTSTSTSPPMTVYTPPRNEDYLKDIKLHKPKMSPIYGYFDIARTDTKPLPSDDDIVRLKSDKRNLTRIMKRRKSNGKTT